MIAQIETLAGTTMTIGVIEKKAKIHSEARTALAEELSQMSKELDEVKNKHMKQIKSLVGRAACTEADLHTAIELGSALFVKPRTITLHGIKCGFAAGKGKIAYDDASNVMKLIRRFFPTKIEVLIHDKSEPNKNGLKMLTEKQLKVLGCRLEGTGDNVVLTPVDDEIEKQISGLISKMVETLTEQEVA